MSEVENSDVREDKVKRDKDEVQITVTLDCESKVQSCLAQVNKDFDFSKVSRKQLVVFLIERGLAEFGEAEIQAVRQSSITDIALLERVYRQARESGVIPEDMRQLLWRSLHLEHSPKRGKKAGQPKYSKAIQEEKEAA